MSRAKALKRVRRVSSARARLHADAPSETLFSHLPEPTCACPTWNHGGALAAAVEACPVHGPTRRAARLRGEALPRSKSIMWPKAPRLTVDQDHHAKLAALLAQGTKCRPRFFTTPNGERAELRPGQHYDSFEKMTDEQYRSLPLKLPVILPRCSVCNRCATWGMIAVAQ